AQSRVSEAMREGYITPAMQGWAVALCRQDPDSFDRFIASSPPAFGHLFEGSGARSMAPEKRFSTSAQSAEEMAVCSQLGIDPAKLAKG
ncbi:phage protease, partial [Roseinatronobacter sp.]|uniref:phage protease n=1 Tax=Roseinatronobacter sp. TaxID=1945755 RepID=UPI0025F1BB88